MKQLILLLCFAALAGCNDSLAQPEPQHADFSERLSTQACTQFGKQSLKLEAQEYQWVLKGYDTNGCNAQAIFEKTFEADSHFGGSWNNFLLVDIGTGDADRELMLLNPTNGEEVITLWYVGEIEFGNSSLTYFQPTRETLNPASCQHAQTEQWHAMGAVLMKSEQMELRSPYNQPHKTGKTGCYGLM